MSYKTEASRKTFYNSSEWKGKRLEALERDNHECQHCKEEGYVTVDSLKRGYIKKYYEGVDSGQKLWIFEGLYSKQFFNDYLLYLNR